MNRREWLHETAAVGLSLLSSAEVPSMPELAFSNSRVKVVILGSEQAVCSITELSRAMTYHLGPPIFPMDGHSRIAALSHVTRSGEVRDLGNGILEYCFIGRFFNDQSLSLEMIFRLAQGSPVLRFRYVLHSAKGHVMSKSESGVRYLRLPFENMRRVQEVRVSVFNDMLHSYTIDERTESKERLRNDIGFIGPIVVGEDAAGNCLLAAYEHGSQAPDAFLQFKPFADSLNLESVKGNYWPGQEVDGFQTPWMEIAVTSDGLTQIARDYRNFVLNGMSVFSESRKPYLFYNTWNFQERNKWWNGQSYLESMNPAQILGEIDVAHRLGIDVYVMDTGWYEKTGEWEVSASRFPDGLKAIRERLDSYGMKLGLWFNPTAAAVSSSMATQYRHCVRTWKGEEGKPRPVWETEASYPMCLVSPYADAFAATLIRVANQTGARYFKWDAIGQYGCDSPHHGHGTSANSQAERADAYAFQLPLRMTGIVEKLSAAFPDAIVDFDITEAGRSVGLSFLSAGKYFLINNGPYAFNYDLPINKEKENWNLFFYPGPARTWICRSPLSYDKWLPSVLFLTHYFPDDPEASQLINVASLILGQNGIWGDLRKISEPGIERLASLLRQYKYVSDDITQSYPIQFGNPGTSPEVHEKISDQTGKGAVVIFSTTRGRFQYVTTHKPSASVWTTPGTHVHFDEQGLATIDTEFDQSSAAIVFFK